MARWTIISLSGCCQAESGGAAYHPLQWMYLQRLSQPCKSQRLCGETVQASKRKTTQHTCSLKAIDLRLKKKKVWFTRLWMYNHALRLHEQFLKWDLLASNLTRLTSKFTRGQQQPKHTLKFVFWSTQAAFLAAIKHGQTYLQGKKQD